MARKPPPSQSLGHTFAALAVAPAIHVEDDPAVPLDEVISEEEIAACLKDMVPPGGLTAASSEDHIYGLMIDLFVQYYANDHTVPMSQLRGPQGGPYQIIFVAYPNAESSLTATDEFDPAQYRPDLMADIMTMWADLSAVGQADMDFGKGDAHCWACCRSAPGWLHVLERLVAYKDFPAPDIERGALMLTRLPALRQAVTQEFGDYVPPGMPRAPTRHRAPGGAA